MTLRFLSQIFHGLSNASEPQLVVAISFIVGVIAMTVAIVVKVCEIIKDFFNKLRAVSRRENKAGESI